jgi:peroxidase
MPLELIANLVLACLLGRGFLQGCDASVLLNQIANGTQTEKQGFPNLSLRGFEVIEEAKAALEKACPRTVSCSDILAFAARDASHMLSNYEIKYYPVPAGRLDGKVSFANETMGKNLPPPFADLALLTKMFADKGLNLSDMVILSGAHTIGRSGCSSFSDRVHPPSSPSTSMDPAFAANLNRTCDTPNSATTTVPQDFDTPNVLDTKYYDNVLAGKVLFTSDAALASSDQTKRLVRFYAGKGVFFDFGLFFGQTAWYRHFEQAMVKMGNIEVKTGPPSKDYEIRKTCGLINPPYTA